MSTAAAPAQAAISKPYDPVQTVAGMFSGSLVRIGMAFQNPKNFGESTKVILAETAKKYQDALDDCESQILDAKWYLERKLAENKARREAEAKAKEANAAAASTAKRKHDEIEENPEPQPEDTPSKRSKTDGQLSPRAATAAQSPPHVHDASMPRDTTRQPSLPSTQPQAVPPVQSQPEQQPQRTKEEKPKLEMKVEQDQDSNSDDFTKPTPQDTSAVDRGEDFFSMFADQAEDADDDDDDDANIKTGDDTFDFTMGDAFGAGTTSTTNNTNTTTSSTLPNKQSQNPTQTQAQSDNPSSLGSLLPGLESYANRTDDTNNGQNQPQDASNELPQESGMDFSQDFGGSNIFDEMLNDTTYDVGDPDFANVNIGNPDEEQDWDELF